MDIIGGDAGASAIVGSSSSAIFYDGVTVWGSNDVGDADSTQEMNMSYLLSDYKRACRY